MKNPVTFCIALHNHQPVGNFGHVFDDAFRKSYAPFLDVLQNHPTVRVSLHTSGPLLDWMEEHQPGYLKRLKSFVDAGRVEILGGGYYEPILTIIPRRDAAMQIETMAAFVERRFGRRPRGIWLTERIWEPGLPELLAENGVEYTLLDESHFRASGVEPDAMIGHYVAEKLGRAVHIFPIRKDLRYAIPFAEPEKTVEILKKLGEASPGTCVTYGDDGEKFGLWPNTYDWVYERRWLEKFFEELAKNSDWLTTATLSEAFDRVPATGRSYLPATSYHEMTQWALPTEAGVALEKLGEDLKKRGEWEQSERFIRGGFWDNFLVKYDEANRLHKRMLRVSEKIARCPDVSAHTTLAMTALMKGQCNCAYWHGLFGGLYLNYLRDAVTRHLAQAESYADLMLHGGASSARVEVADFDLDGRHDVILESPWYRAVVNPADGGTLADLVLVRQNFDITNVMTRRREIYHERVRQATTATSDGVVSAHDMIVAKETGLEEYLRYDRNTRVAFRDRAFAEIPTLDQTLSDIPESVGRLADLRYDFSVGPDADSPRARLVASTEISADGVAAPIRIEKEFRVAADTPEFVVSYRWTNTGATEVRFVWAAEMNFTLLAADASDRWVTVNGLRHSPRESFDATTSLVALHDGWQDFTMSVDLGSKATLRQYPIETVSQSEAGFERTYQGTCLVVYRTVAIEPGRAATASFTFTVLTGAKD